MKSTNYFIAPFFLFLLLLVSCEKQEIVINNIADFETYLQDEMQAQNMPALSTLIFKGDNILYESQFGLSQIAQNISLEEDHLFLLASISKVVTATALLQLAEKGLFELNDPINDYLPFQVQVPDYSTDITFQMLLTHTSGIADGSALDDAYYYGKDSPVALKYFLENYLTVNGEFYDASDNFYDFEPGSEHEYSNVGSALIGVLVEEISGVEFNTYCKQNIFEPLGMNHTSWRLDEITQPIVQPYNYRKGDYEEIEHYTFTDYPNGGLRSTARDLFTLLRAFVSGGQVNGYQLLSSETIQKMMTLQIPNLSEDMGLHLFLMNAQHNLWGHDGGEQGVATTMAFNPDSKIGVIVLTNQGDADLEEILEEAYEMGKSL